ncbi:MAG: methyltransferase regulatory domain-containing protein [Dehalococcoidia bacterium]
MATQGAETSYDDVPYEGGMVPGTHPEHLAVLGTLFGMQPKDVRRCRVLEIGCALGGNILPMAYSLPDGEFVGIDLSARQIAMGQRLAREFDVKNLTLLTADVRALENWTDLFDYIICHGVLTWVPLEVQQAIFSVCRKLLAPQGIAYISYNALPGFHFRAGIGEMLRYHARNFPTAEERAEQAGALLDFLVDATSTFAETQQLGAYHRVLSIEHEILKTTPSFYLSHEHLVDEPSAFYLHEFIEFVTANELQYLGDTSFNTMMLRDLPDDIAEKVNSIAHDQIALEQYRDFVVNRGFRRSLVCRKDVELHRFISPEAIQKCLFHGLLKKDDTYGWKIAKVGGGSAIVSEPAVAAVLETLDAALPRALSFDELLARTRESAAVDVELLCAILLSLLSLNAVSFRTWAPDAATEIGERPVAYWPALKLAALGNTYLTSPFHETWPEDPFACRLISLLDGTRTLDDLAKEMESHVEGQESTVENLSRRVADGLETIRRAGLLVSEPSARPANTGPAG